MHRFWLSLVLFVAATSPVYSAPVTFSTVVSDATNSYGVPVINNSGTVAYFESTSADVYGIYSSNGSFINTITPTNVDWRYLSGPYINNSGQVAYWGQTSAGSMGIYVSSGGPTTTIIAPTVIGPNVPTYLSPGGIADNGTVAFVGGNNHDNDDLPSFSGIYSGNGGPITTLYSNSSFNEIGGTDLAASSNGQYVVFTTPSGGSAAPIQEYAGETVSTIATTGAGNPFFSVNVNNNNEIVFGVGNGSSWSNDLWSESGGQFTPIAGSGGASYPGGPEFDYFTGVSLNNLNQVAFEATFYSAPEAIVLANGSGFERIVGVGDSLDGSTITALTLGQNGLNDNDQIAFWASLANGQNGIFIASVATPEPSTIGLIAAGAITALLVASYRRIRRLAWAGH